MKSYEGCRLLANNRTKWNVFLQTNQLKGTQAKTGFPYAQLDQAFVVYPLGLSRYIIMKFA